jgi:UDP-N-acetylglucosamine--N-acetylmuramyl-(pentapeptide) pyrophosphoryl-undecaprenol N-acetylglucosamine transferase
MIAVITGGHPTPALAVCEIMKKKRWKVYWVGEEKALTGQEVKTLEARIVPSLGIPFFSVMSAKLHRKRLFFSILSFWKIFIGILQSFLLLIRLHPNVILSFGSYVSVPVCVAGWLLRIPIVIHEQTTAPGLANRIIARLACKVAVSFPIAEEKFPKDKVVFTGNPIRRSIFETAYKRKKFRSSPPVLYITGGSRGAQAINEAVACILDELLSTFEVYHQTGDLDFKKFAKVKNPRYHVAPILTPQEVEKIYAKADIVVSRAGANTVSELSALGIPTILIPLPGAASNEQLHNAEFLAKAGTAEIILQDELSGKVLLSKIKKMLESLPRYKARAPYARRLVRADAAKRLFETVEFCVVGK